MGSTNANLAWGIDLEDFWELPEGCDEDDPVGWVENNLDLNGVQLFMHCSYSAPMYILSPSVELSAYRGWAMEISTKDLVVESDWQRRLDAACEKLGIPKQKGSWLLYSFWGV